VTRSLVICEDATEFRVVRAACRDRTVYDWLSAWLAPESIDPGAYLAELVELASGWRASAPAGREELAAAVASADALMVERETIDEELLGVAPEGLRSIVCLGTIAGNVDLDACARRGIEVRTVRRPTTSAVAEHAIMLLLVVARGFVGEGSVRPGDAPPAPAASQVEAGGHPGTAFNWKGAPPPLVLSGRRLGVLGAGETARAVMRLGRCIGMEVAYWSRTQQRGMELELGVSWMGWDALARWADAVSVHLAYAPELKHVVDARFLNALGPEGILVNTARGMLVDPDALQAALRNGTIRGAGLDVFPEEPSVPAGLLGLENVALTPHVAAGSRWVIADDVRELFRALDE
jgi:lactate dehydrogenase-like 2-hydroxyacid dehydrogenase